MMRKWLANPVVVTILALIAIIVVVRNVISPLQPDSATKTERNPASIGATSALPPTAPIAAGHAQQPSRDNRVKWSQIGWPEQPQRDPFRLAAAVKKTPPAQTVETDMRLSGTIIHDNERFAHIDGKVVAEGDAVDGYRVLQIRQDRVVLLGPMGRKLIRLGETNR